MQDDPGEETPPPVATTGVQVVTTPAGATVLVDGQERGAAPLEVQLPIGQAATVVARLAGHTEASREVTATEGQAAIRLTLQAMPYVIHVETTPPGARVRSSAGTVTTPGDLRLRAAPSGPLALTAQLRGHEDGSHQVQVADFAESEGRMVATVTLTLTERAAPVRPTPPAGGGTRRPPREAGGGEAGGGEAGGGETGGGAAGGGAAGGGTRPAGGGEGGGGTQPAGGGTQPAGGGSQPAGGGSQPAGGGESGGGGSPTPPPPPDNPFG
ncbi:MAG: PEGA domain-containing protein [Sandaracinaceae bacterium]|nr:PEGA domain-containing protein [Sandaracinaceae bacterium]